MDTPLGPVPAPAYADGTPVTVAIRPIGSLDVRTEGPGVPGRVLAKRDAIGIDLCEVSVAGLDRPIQLRRRADRNLEVGSDVFLNLNPEHVLVFAKD